jgi:transposase-like protein
LQTPRAQDVGLFRRVLGGLSCRDDEAATVAVPEACGLTTSSVSRRVVRARAKALPRLHERRHGDAEWLVLLLDGKLFADDQVVIALGVTPTGEKRLLGLVQTATENQRVCAAFLRELVARGVQTPTGLLVVLAGATGMVRRNGPSRNTTVMVRTQIERMLSAPRSRSAHVRCGIGGARRLHAPAPAGIAALSVGVRSSAAAADGLR